LDGLKLREKNCFEVKRWVVMKGEKGSFQRVSEGRASKIMGRELEWTPVKRGKGKNQSRGRIERGLERGEQK